MVIISNALLLRLNLWGPGGPMVYGGYKLGVTLGSYITLVEGSFLADHLCIISQCDSNFRTGKSKPTQTVSVNV